MCINIFVHVFGNIAVDITGKSNFFKTNELHKRFEIMKALY